MVVEGLGEVNNAFYPVVLALYEGDRVLGEGGDAFYAVVLALYEGDGGLGEVNDTFYAVSFAFCEGNEVLDLLLAGLKPLTHVF